MRMLQDLSDYVDSVKPVLAYFISFILEMFECFFTKMYFYAGV